MARRGKRPNQHRPGDYPHLRSGHHRRNVAAEHDVQAMVSRVGSNVLYAKFLELGLIPGGNRYPWLSLALREHRSTIMRILTRGTL